MAFHSLSLGPQFCEDLNSLVFRRLYQLFIIYSYQCRINQIFNNQSNNKLMPENSRMFQYQFQQLAQAMTTKGLPAI